MTKNEPREAAQRALTDEEIKHIAETLPGNGGHPIEWGMGFRKDGEGYYTIPYIPAAIWPFARAIEKAIASSAAANEAAGQQEKFDALLAQEHALSDAYVRLREILGAMDPPDLHSPQALWAYVEEVARQRVAAHAKAEPMAERIGDTRFEGWLGCHEPDRTDGRRPSYTKKDMGKAYWAGYQEATAMSAQPVAGEPVAWRVRYSPNGVWHVSQAQPDPTPSKKYPHVEVDALYTHSAPAVASGLTEALDALDDYIARINGDDRGSCELANVIRRHLSTPSPVAPEPAVRWLDVIAAITAAQADNARRGGMFPQEADEHARDAEAVVRIRELLQWYGDAAYRLAAWPKATPAEPVAPGGVPHSDDIAVDKFAAAMKEKLAAARAKGRGGWETCPPAELARMLRDHVSKGDPRDVANFCMFLWHLGGSTAEQMSRDGGQDIPFAPASNAPSQAGSCQASGDGHADVSLETSEADARPWRCENHSSAGTRTTDSSAFDACMRIARDLRNHDMVRLGASKCADAVLKTVVEWARAPECNYCGCPPEETADQFACKCSIKPTPAAPNASQASSPPAGRTLTAPLKSLSATVADALRQFTPEGAKVIWRESFRWHDDNGVLSNHYDGMNVPSLAAEFGYEVIHDCGCAAVIRGKQCAEAAKGRG